MADLGLSSCLALATAGLAAAESPAEGGFLEAVLVLPGGAANVFVREPREKGSRSPLPKTGVLLPPLVGCEELAGVCGFASAALFAALPLPKLLPEFEPAPLPAEPSWPKDLLGLECMLFPPLHPLPDLESDNELSWMKLS